MDVGKNIKHLGELKNYSQAYMAQQLGISQRQYSNIESNVNNITITILKKLLLF
jgi:transcriptional regulator with XRE-family HTH domain